MHVYVRHMAQISCQCFYSSVILTHPTDKISFLNDDALLTCLTVPGYIAHWRLNETDYDNLPSQLQDDLDISSGSAEHSDYEVFRLTILARAEYNGTRVQCVAESDDGQSVVSDTATLTIQGMVQALLPSACVCSKGTVLCLSVCLSVYYSSEIFIHPIYHTTY